MLTPFATTTAPAFDTWTNQEPLLSEDPVPNVSVAPLTDICPPPVELICNGPFTVRLDGIVKPTPTPPCPTRTVAGITDGNSCRAR